MIIVVLVDDVELKLKTILTSTNLHLLSTRKSKSIIFRLPHDVALNVCILKLLSSFDPLSTITVLPNTNGPWIDKGRD